jgi:hypothetical protein
MANKALHRTAILLCSLDAGELAFWTGKIKMTLLEFISSIISSLAWPAIVLIVVFVLKNPLSKILISLTKFRYKGLEMEFERLQSSADALPETIENKTIPESERIIYASLEEQIADISPRSPEGAILIAWSTIEAAISSAIMRLAISPESPSYRSVIHNIECLKKYTNLNKTVFAILDDLRVVRNQVAHVRDGRYRVSVEQALSYGKTAEKIIKILQNLKR